MEWLARTVAGIKQKATSRGGRRPFGICTIIGGHDMDGTPQLWQTDPSGNFSSWKATCAGRNAKSVRELLEEEYEANMSEEDSVKLACQALMESAERGSKGIEVAVLRHSKPMEMMTSEAIQKVCSELESEDAEAAEGEEQ